ncbi:unnamed protein product [Lactuca virosa]|uniref:Uncharacterized protein n=1 Tax=Lactuca virosa TaxID=75947 RepID=A0AAU9LCL8_9ASTR|nr:unnamed protein product [Lactuca virosa]
MITPRGDVLFYFKDGLRDWEKDELNKKNVQTLDDAISIAESLLDYRPPQKNPPAAKSGGDRKASKKFEDRRMDIPRFENQFRKDTMKAPNKPSFIFDGPHWTRECPSRKAMNTLVADMVGKPDEEVDAQEELGSVRHLGDLTKLLSKYENEDN